MIKLLFVWFIISVIFLLYNLISGRIHTFYNRVDPVLNYIEDILLLPVVILIIIIASIAGMFER